MYTQGEKNVKSYNDLLIKTSLRESRWYIGMEGHSGVKTKETRFTGWEGQMKLIPLSAHVVIELWHAHSNVTCTC